MYLLHRDGPGQPLRLSQFFGAEIPPYAILSHTWGSEYDEVSFKDVRKSRGQEKDGYKKIQFCLARAEADGLRHCWVDTCCIDQKNNVELSEAINSMFWWYSRAKKCYVYLSDVPTKRFRDSRWFTRGWTLQELLAPRNVEFYNSRGNLLGYKLSMIQELHDITKVPLEALEGCSLSRFDFAEIVSWVINRQTKREEDMAYSLLGLFDVSMPLIYGERHRHAFARLKKHVDESQLAQTADYLHDQEAFQQSFAVSFMLPRTEPSAVFLGRDEEMTRLEEALPLNGLRECVVLHGMGGIGKTQLALHFATKHRHDYSAIFWMDGQTKDSIEESFLVVKRRLQGRDVHSAIPDLKIDASSNHDAIKSVLTWLCTPSNTRWLMVIDNADDPYIRGKTTGLYNVQSYIPASKHGHVIITSRSPQLYFGKQLELREIKDDAACLQLLKHHSRRRSIELEPGANDLLKILGGLPLALCQAGECLRQSTMDISKYLTMYEKSWVGLQHSSPQLSDYQGRTLQITWETSLNQVETANPITAKLLLFLANLDCCDVWYDLLAAGREGAPDWFASVVCSQASFDHHMQKLCDVALLRACDSSVGYEMHRFMHDWLRATYSQDYSWSALALGCISRSVPPNDSRDYWVQQQRLLRHADQWVKSVSRRGLQDAHAANDLAMLGRLYYDQGRLTEAEAMYHCAMSCNEKDSGLHSLLAAGIQALLGVVHHDQGKLAESEACLTRALHLQESASGALQPWVLETVRQLGRLYLTQDRLPHAQSMLTRAYNGFVSIYGYDHSSTLQAAGSLAMLYDPAIMSGKQNESRLLYERAMKGCKEILGATHPLYLTVLAEYGQSCWLQYEDEEGGLALSQALAGLRKTLGPNHMRTVRVAKIFAAFLITQDKDEEAGSLLRENLTLSKKCFGSSHLLTISIEDLLADIMVGNKDQSQAEELYSKVLKEREQQLGPCHLLTLLAVSKIGRYFESQQKYTESEEYLERALKGFRKRSPDFHRTFQAMYDIATLYVSLCKYSAAESMFMHAIAGYKTHFGPGYPKMASILSGLARMYESQGRYPDAETLWYRSLIIDQKKYGMESTYALTTRHHLAVVFERQHKWMQARDMYTKVYDGRKRLLGSEHDETRNAKRLLENAIRQCSAS